MVVVTVLGGGLAAAGLVLLLAGRWPAVAAPHVSAERIVEEVEQHSGLARHLRRHYDPKTETGVALAAATALVAVAAAGIGIVLALVRSKFGVESVDVRLAQYGARNATPWSTDVLRFLTEPGGTRVVVGLAVVATAVEYVRRPSRALPLFMALVVAGQFAMSNAIKLIVERARPDFDRLVGFAGTSFPSGHSTAAAATLAAIALIATRDRSRRVQVMSASAAVGLAVIVAGTRVMLGVHWFSDVAAGLLLGWGWFSLCSIAFGGRLLSFGRPVAVAEAAAGTPS